jgi:hypothetical protein
MQEMLLRGDELYVEALRAHLEAEGFPAVRVGEGTLDVPFPASPAVFAAAVELDDWRAHVGCDVNVQVVASPHLDVAGSRKAARHIPPPAACAPAI